MILAAVLMGAASAQDAVPQNWPIEAERFRPAVDPYGYVITEGTAPLSNLQVTAGLWGNYSQDQAILRAAGERLVGPPPGNRDGVLDERTLVDLQLGMGLFDVFSLTVDAPFVVWQTGSEPAAPAIVSDEPVIAIEPAGVGDLRVTPKLALVDVDKGYHVGLAVWATGSIPLGNRRSFISEGTPTIAPMIGIEAASGSIRKGDYLVRGAINLGGRFKQADEFVDVSFGNEFLYRAAIAARPTNALELGVDLAGASGGNQIAVNPVEMLPWLRLRGLDVATFTVGSGFGLTSAFGSPDWRVFAGITLAPSFDPLTLDRDDDGVPNRYDQCINIPEDRDGFEDRDGCPDYDNDQDGIVDQLDRCPDVPEDADGFADDDGCPDYDNDEDGVVDVQDACPLDKEDADGFRDLDGCPDDDNDGDNILDRDDACPNAAETVNGFQDDDGCPDEKPFLDRDGDGLSDEVDKCPDQPEDVDTWQDDDGCPDDDNDLDGVVDSEDQCPFDPETINQYLDADGCPDTAPTRVEIVKQKIVIKERVFFEYGKAVIRDQSFSLLEEVADVINDNPRVQLVQVEGHTDSDGSEGFNLRLSASRARSVVQFLVRAGVDPVRLRAKGFGESLPIDTNSTPSGRQNNRRVEFTIVDQD
ncbi:MAG: OmpA family protein [Myxococcota bacterium]